MDNEIENNFEAPFVLRAVLIFAVTFALYFFTRSPALDEIDSVQFAMGVREFNIAAQQPHAPGYPLFIFFGWLGATAFHWSPELSLHVVAALGGAIFIAAWFLIIRLQFSETFAWWLTVCLAITPAVWMTATKVLSDSFAAGLFSVELLAALFYLRRGTAGALIAAALCGAAAAGARPQMIVIALAVIVTVLMQRRAKMKSWLLGLSAFFAGCFVWFISMCYAQMATAVGARDWFAYPKLLLAQWTWRLDKPQIFLGAGDWSAKYFALRFVQHFLAWFGRGFGLIASPGVLIAGFVLCSLGIGAYLFRKRDERDRAFWKFHSGWALLHIAIVFVCLPGAQRYYLIIFPLLLSILLRGFLQFPKPWSFAACAWVALLLFISVPIAVANHNEEAPPVRLIRFLEKIYPPDKRKNVVLLFSNVKRHAQWYAPQFRTFRQNPTAAELPEILDQATAVYVDDARKIPLPPGWRLIPLVEFGRSSIIHAKHRHIVLYLVARRAQP